ncbi:glycosyltransferase family 2 protein [Cohnella thailandensis]|jgi:Glycosyltransferases involved in cell wall biogenesis|uniref:Glycosyltransferase family 2 protein n=1 Tax=Cohnella thailandensis TaxID=557557 RepID=A0A841SKH1_9BACL|nr:glycosyltransferase family 2 protein [Cohnella thailandensis]MBB6633013.1 glycosyltransferase family 2 protein [Cohnella thailandensis]MBP1975292.1 glycosyltransferase involved in cell wall biosynthesis [Cohnella thailandensis]
MKEVSVVVPIYNERDDLMRLYFAITGALDPHVGEYEIILVNDGSTDGSGPQLDKLAESDAKIRVIHFEQNCGQTAAISAGLKAAEGRYVALMDGDLQTFPEDIVKLLPYMEQYDFANGTRVDRKDTLVKKVSSKVGNGVRNKITGDRIQDTGCPMKLFKREVAQSFNLYEGFHRFLPTLARMNGFSVVEVPVGHRERTAGTSKYGVLNRAFVGLMDAIVIGWLRKRTINYQIRGE